MKYEKKPLSEQLKSISVMVSLFLTVGGVAISLINYFSLIQLQPFNARLVAIEKAQATAEVDRNTLATKEQIESLKTMVNGRLTSIENKVEFLYQKGLK